MAAGDEGGSWHLGAVSQPVNPWAGRCYQAANSEAMDRYCRNDTTRIVHGTVAGRKELKGRRIQHAWIEFDAEIEGGRQGMTLRFAFDPTAGRRGVLIPAITYHRFGRVRVSREYTCEEATRLMVGTGHHGPWRKVERKRLGLTGLR